VSLPPVRLRTCQLRYGGQRMSKTYGDPEDYDRRYAAAKLVNIAQALQGFQHNIELLRRPNALCDQMKTLECSGSDNRFPAVTCKKRSARQADRKGCALAL